MFWKQPDFGHFDNIFASTLLLFEMSSMEMWPDVMLRGMDITDVGLAPVANNTVYYSFYFAAVIICGNFFFFSLVSGAVVETFIDAQKDIRGDFLVTAEQTVWRNIHKLSFSITRRAIFYPPTTQWRLKLYELCHMARFDNFISLCIVINTIVLACYTYKGDHNQYLDMINYVLFAIFTVEAVLKLMAFGFSYFGDGWNRFDFFIVVMGYVTVILEGMDADVGMDFTVLRVFRAARVIRLVRRAKTLNKLVSTIVAAVPALNNVALFGLIFLFMYSVIGMSAFGQLPRRSFLTEHANFENFPSAMLTLFRSATGESWNGIMHDCMVQPCPYPDHHEECGSYLAIPYFISFVVLFQLVVVSLIIGIAMEQFETAGNDLGIHPDDVYEFHVMFSKRLPRPAWYTYVVPFTGKKEHMLPLTELDSILGKLPHPLERGAKLLATRKIPLPIWRQDAREGDRPLLKRWAIKYSVTLLILVVASVENKTGLFLSHTGLRRRLKKIHKVIDLAVKDHDPALTTTSLLAVRQIEKAYLKVKENRRKAVASKTKTSNTEEGVTAGPAVGRHSPNREGGADDPVVISVRTNPANQLSPMEKSETDSVSRLPSLGEPPGSSGAPLRQ